MPGSYNQGSEHHGIDIHSINQVKDANGNTDYIVDVSNHTRVASNGHKTVDGKYSLNQLLSSGAISQKTHDFFVSEHDQAANASPETSNDHELTAQQYVDRENKSFPGNKKINDTLRKSHYTAIRSHADQGGKISQEVFDSLDGLRRTNLKNNYGEGVVKAPAQETANPIHDNADASKKGENVDTVDNSRVPAHITALKDYKDLQEQIHPILGPLYVQQAKNGRIGDARLDSQISKLEKQLQDAELKYVHAVDEKHNASNEVKSGLSTSDYLGKNEDDQSVHEDKNGKRYIQHENGLQEYESVSIVPSRNKGVEIKTNPRNEKFLIVDDSVGQPRKDYVKNEANSQENSYDNSGKDNTRTTEDPARNTSKTINQSGVSDSQSKEPDQSRAGSSEKGIRSGSGQYDSINTDQSKGNGLSGNEGLGGHQADVSTEHAVGRETSTDKSISESIGANNLSLIDKPAIALTPAKRRDVNILAEAILKKPVNDITEDDKNILRQYTGHGGLDVKASADKGEGIFNQHYSAYDTIKAMYGALMDAGVKMDNNLEPSVGSGNFIGMHPRANWTAVDIDTTNTEVVRRLYPDASVFNESYETFRGKNFDLIISNVPFASFSSLAREHAGTIKPAFKAIHNFFFAQSVDKLKTGGVMAFMTSTGTMDGIGEGQRLREHLIQKMDVIGAFRLPMGTQKANASTDVMIDVIFLQKRPDGVVSKQPEKNQAFVDIANKDGYKINQYFVDYPESVLGDLSIGANKTSMGKVGWIVTGDADYSKMAIEPQDYSATVKSSRSEFATPEAAQAYAIKKGLKFTDKVADPYFQDGFIFDTPVTYSDVSGSGLFGRKATGVQAEKLAALKKIDETHDAKLVQQYEEKYSKAPHTDKQLTLWAKVNHAAQQLKSYLALFDKHFNLSEIFTKQVRFKDSGKIEINEHSSLMDRAESVENADGIFSPKTDLISADEIQDLLSSGDYAQLSNGSLQNARLYYAGNIYKKIDDATKVKPASQRDKQLAKLNRVKPALWTIDKISFSGKESWLPASAIASIGIQNYADGTKLIGGHAIADNHLLHLYNQYINNDDLVKKDSKETPEEYADRLKAAQTLVHTEILPLIKQKILDDGLADEVAEAYNREKNFFAAPIFDGSSLRNLPTQFKGKPFQLMLHQLEGAERAIYNKKGVLAFSPGLGKTPTAIIVADQLLQKGVMKKPLFIVPANTIPQWESSTRSLYPDAKVYEFPKYKTGINKGKVKEWPSMTAADKEQMVYDLTNNQYDYTFISTNLAQKFSIPAKKLSQYLDELTESISGMEKPDEELSKSQIKAKETRIAKIRMLKATMMNAYKESIDTGFDMGKMGFDALFADEVQYYKNIGMQSEDAKGGIGANVAINAKYPLDADGKQDKTKDPLSVTLGSSRSYDFRFKTRFISENNNGNNIFLLTGTPTPNKPLELMTLLHHLDIHILDEYGINNVGDFVNEFFDIQEVEETGIDGTNKLQAALVGIMNIPALKSIITRFIDYRSPESAKDLTRPKQIDKVHTILRNDASEEIFADVQTRILQSIEDAQAKKSGDKGVIVEPMIKMYGAGRDASIDVRLYTPSVDEKGDIAPGTLFEKETRSDYSKIAKTVELVAAKNKLDPEAGQLIFLDRLKFSGDNGSTHEDIRNDILKATGLDPKEVIFVSGQAFVNPDTGKQVSSGPKPEVLQKIMDYYNEGKIKVLIGNTSKLGVGVDLQVTTTDIYQIDKPYRPDEIEQRNNRGVRQGNRNSEVTVHTFNQPGTFDAMSDRIIANKQGFNDVFWKEQESDKADVKAEEAPSAYDAAIELEQDPFRKRKLEVERDLSGAAYKSSNLEKQISNLAKRIRTATTNHDAYLTANQGIDNRPTPLYEDQSESERKKSIAAFKVRMTEQRAKNVVRIGDLAKDIIDLNAEKDARQVELEAHKEHIASIRAKYVVNGIVSIDKIKTTGDVKFSKSTTPVVNPHSKTSLNQAVTKAMDTLFGQGWTNRLMATGKFKMISAAEATGLIGKNAMFHKVWHGSPHDHNKFDSAYIDTGEGAQAFGWGHYFSDLKTIAEWYRDRLQNKQVKLLVDGKDVTELARVRESRAIGILLDELKYPNMGTKNGLSEDQIKAIIDKVILEQTPRSGENDPNWIKSQEKVRDYLTELKTKKLEIGRGKLYEVDLAPSQDEYLDWDKPMLEQSSVVKAAINRNQSKDPNSFFWRDHLLSTKERNITGGEFYKEIAGSFEDSYNQAPNDEAVSNYLHSIGIRGIRYKAEQGQSEANNYVVFNDADVKIEIKYSKNGDVIAFYNPADDTTYLVHDNITQNTSAKALQGLMLHEIGVHALTLGKSNEVFKDILRRFEALKKTNPKVQAAFARVPKGTKAEDIVEEALAYYLEEHPKSSLAQRIVEWFRQAVRALGKALPVLERAKFSQWANKLTEAELIGMATSALKSAPDSLQFDNVGRQKENIKLEQQQQRFYSALRKAFRDAPDKVFGNPEQVKLWIAGNSAKFDVKKDEIYWSGINDWLGMQTGKVSKADVLNYLDQNGVQVEDVMLGKEKRYSFDREIAKINSSNELKEAGIIARYDPIDEDITFNDGEDDLTIEDFPSDLRRDIKPLYNDFIDAIKKDRPLETKHGEGSLVIPGGRDYKELVVTIPTTEKFNESDSTHFGDVGKGKQIAWLRMNTRTDANGKESLFLEEVQSQRGQQGRTKGFTEAGSVFSVETDANNNWFVVDNLGHTITMYGTEEMAKETADNWTKNGLPSYLYSRTRDGVPAAPFVTDSNNKATNAYISLLLKKAISHAIDNGMDSVSWTTGDQQADRYELSKQLDKLTIKRDAYGTYDIDGVKDGELIVGKVNVEEEELAGIVGKDIAEKAIAGQTVFKGAGLQVGGAWTQAMYGDENGLNAQGKPSMIMQAAMEIARKMGSEVGSVEIGAKPRAMKVESIRDGGYYAVVDSETNEALSEEVNAADYAFEDLAKLRKSEVLQSKQPALIITPTMKAKILNEGMPLFSKAGELLAPNGKPSNLNAMQHAQVRTEAFKKWFGDWENDPENASKVVDENGEPLVVYHGTDNIRDVFKKGESGALGPGIYTTQRKDHAKTYGDYVQSLYVNSKNPLIISDTGRLDITEAIARDKKFEEENFHSRGAASKWAKDQFEEHAGIGDPEFNTMLRDAGYDSIIYKKGNVFTELSVQNPNQIKSATENNGDFSQSNNNIKFSRSTPSNTPADNSAMRSFFAKAQGKQALGWLAGLFQRNHLIDFVAQDLPELINYKLLSQEKDNFTNQRENEIGKSYKEMLDKLDKKTMHELGRVQGMATRLVKFDPATIKSDGTPAQHLAYISMSPEQEAAYDAYTAMPESAKEAYATMRDAYQADLMEKKRALIERIKAFPADKETQAEIIRTIEQHFDQFKEGVYFPLNRDGSVIVKATNADGELVIEHVATQADAYKLVKEMTAQGYDNTHIIGKDAYDRDLLAGNAANEMAALAHKTISDLKEKSVQGKLTESDFNDLFSEFNQLLINTLPDSSYRKHFIHRKGTLGESTDTLRAYSKTRVSAVKMIASLTYDHQIQDVLNNADKAIKEMDKVAGSDTLAIKSIVNELKLREAALKSTEINAVSQVLTSLGFMGALGFNIGSAAVNMLQVVGVALPELIGRHGYIEATKEVSAAYKLLFNPANLDKASGLDITKNPHLTAIAKQAMEYLVRIGKIDLTMTHDSIAAGKDPSYSSNPATRAFGAAAKYSGYFFHVAEAANRQITGMAAFNLAYKKNGGNFEAAIAEAVDVIDRTQFDYGQGNRARYMMSNTARVLTLFKAYALGMSYYIGRNAYQYMKGETPEVRLQARKTLIASMAMSFATAGLFGMPIGIEAFAGIGGVAAFKYKGAKFAVPGAIGGMLIFQALLAGLGADDEDELETEFRNWLTDNFDQTTAEFVTKGPARLLPIGDIASRTSQSELWWRSQNKQLEGTDQYNAIATALIGPIGSQVAGLFTAKKMYEDGQYSRMVESMSPAFLRNAIAANRMGTEGVTNLKGDKIIQRDLTPVELINKVIGFNPTVVTNTYDANSAIAKESTKHTLAKSHLVNRWMSGDATERSDLMKGAIKDFNESVPPSERITLKSLFKSMRSRKGIDRHTQNGLYLSKKQNYLRDIGRFNRQE